METYFSKILRLARTLYKNRIMRVGFVGGIGFLIQTAIFEIGGVYLGLGPLSTWVVIGAETAIFTCFFLNQKFSFQVTDAHGPLWKRLLKYHLVALGSVFIQWLFVFIAERLTTDLLILHAVYVAGILTGFIWTYNGYRLFVWKQHHTPSQ